MDWLEYLKRKYGSPTINREEGRQLRETEGSDPGDYQTSGRNAPEIRQPDWRARIINSVPPPLAVISPGGSLAAKKTMAWMKGNEDEYYGPSDKRDEWYRKIGRWLYF